MARDATYHYKGEKEITIVSHTASQHCLSACLSVCSNGDILTPLIVARYITKKLKNEEKPTDKSTTKPKKKKVTTKILRTCPKNMIIRGPII